MIHYNNLSDLETIKSLEEKTEDFISLDKSLDSKFEENFMQVFCEKKIIDLEEDIESDNFVEEKPSLSCVFVNSRENFDNTLDKSKDKITKNKEENCNDLSSFSILGKSMLNEQKQNEIKSSTETEKETPNISNFEQKEENISIRSDNFLGKKRNLFKTYYPEDFLIFNCGEFNMNARELINKVVSKNVLKENEEESFSKSANKKKYCKKILNVEKRKENADNIRKKIKCRFFKSLKQAVNEKLKMAGSKLIFKNLPQTFISNISKNTNKSILNLSFKDLFLKNFCEKKNTNSDLSNYSHNLDTLEYLEQQNEISKKSNFIKFKNIKFHQIYNEYLKSKEFEMEIASLKSEKENDKYIKNYIIKASSLMNFFSN